jgi:hypothetical protein
MHDAIFVFIVEKRGEFLIKLSHFRYMIIIRTKVKLPALFNKTIGGKS